MGWSGQGLDRLPIIGRRHLERVFRTQTAQYNEDPPHRGLALLPPDQSNAQTQFSHQGIKGRDQLGGLIHEYQRAAA